MNDYQFIRTPKALDAIRKDTEALGFAMASEPRTGALLMALAASKPAGHLLELGTGTGIGTAWLLAGMDAEARLDSVDIDANVLAVARRHLGEDPRVTFHETEGAEFLGHCATGHFDLVFADAWPGKFTHLDEALSLVRIGGIYLIDDLLPQPTWPEGHAPKVSALIDRLKRLSDFASVKLDWASGLMILVRTQSLD